MRSIGAYRAGRLMRHLLEHLIIFRYGNMLEDEGRHRLAAIFLYETVARGTVPFDLLWIDRRIAAALGAAVRINEIEVKEHFLPVV